MGSKTTCPPARATVATAAATASAQDAESAWVMPPATSAPAVLERRAQHVVGADGRGGAAAPHVDELARAAGVGGGEVDAVGLGPAVDVGGVDAAVVREADDALAQLVVADGRDEPDRGARGGGRGRGVQRVAGEGQPHLVGLGERDRRGELDEHLAEHDHVEPAAHAWLRAAPNSDPPTANAPASSHASASSGPIPPVGTIRAPGRTDSRLRR